MVDLLLLNWSDSIQKSSVFAKIINGRILYSDNNIIIHYYNNFKQILISTSRKSTIFDITDLNEKQNIQFLWKLP